MLLPSPRLAARIAFTLLSLTIGFHLLVMAGTVPFHIVGGGRLETREEMLRMEPLALAVNLAMLAIVAAYAGIIRFGFPERWLRVALWIMAAVFFLNTVGNLFARHWLETAIFTPITLVLGLLSLRMALGDRTAMPWR